MKKIFSNIVIALLLTVAFNATVVEAARTDSKWNERNGTWLETAWSEGRDILINGIDKYLNFGFDSGEDGYGFRDDAGRVQFKHEGGVWADIGSGSGSGGLSTTTPWTAGDLVRVVSNGSVDSVATSSLGLPLFSDLANYLSLSSWFATTTDALDEGVTNLYFTNARAQSALSGLYEVPLTFGDALTRTLNDIDFDGGATPSGDLGGTWASPSVTDDSHAHTGTTISGVDISDDTNLTAGDGLTLTADDIDCDTASGSVFGCLTSTDWTTFNSKVSTSRALTVAGTANQITSSAGAQDLSADRTWTLSLPSHVIFPSSFFATSASTTNATTTNLAVTGLTSALVQTDASGNTAEYAGTSCTNQFVRSLSALGIGTCATVANTDLANSSVSYGGVSVSLGGSDATPAFNLADATGLPISTGVSGLASGIATFLGTPSSANLDTAVTDDTGSGALVFATSPTITTSIIGTSNPTIGDTTLGNKFGNVYLTNSGDLFPDHDVYGLWDRKINYGFSPDEEWSQNADELTWTGYASYTGFVTPANITTTLSAYSVAHNDGVKRAFRYRSAATSTQIYLRARATVTFLNGGGLMIDDGVDDGDGQGATNFYRVYIKQSALAGDFQVFEEYRTGGGAVTTNTGPTIPYGEFIGIGLRCLAGTLWTSYTCNPFTFSEAQSSVQFTGGTALMSWTPVRVGLFSEFSATDFGRRAIWDWYDEAAI